MSAARRTRTLFLLPSLLALAGCDGAPAPEGAGYNVLLLSLDSTRRDLLSTYGREPRRAPDVPTSPNLDRLGAEGAVMLDAYATSSWTLPSHVALLTGQPDTVHGVDIDYLRLEGGHPMLAELLSARGYRTAGFYSGPYLEPRFGFGRGFERYEACYGEALGQASERHARLRAELLEAQASGDATRAREALEAVLRADEAAADAAHVDRSSEAVVDAALEELEAAARDERPFFLFAHLFDPHYDYLPPAPYDRRFDPDYSGPLSGVGFYDDPRISVEDDSRQGGRRRTASERDLEHVLALYEGELSWTDAQIGRLLDRLDELGLAERTLVVLTSDHGDEFFEHGGIGHRHTLYEELVAVPLLLRLPARIEPRRVPGVVSIADVVPTVLDLLELPAAPGLASESFARLIDGDEDGSRRSALCRLVTQEWRAVELGGGESLRCKQVRVEEAFRLGPIKVTRVRSWPEADEAGAAERVAALREEERARETLRWIDLERSPGERPEDHSDDFSDPRALEALRAFHARYGELLLLRRGARLRPDGEALPPGLRGLGYAGDEEPVATPGSSELFRLPPPGARVLYEAR